MYLVAIIDWATRKVLAWRLSNTLNASFCVEALKEAIAKCGKPKIMKGDQGSQFNSVAWITTLTEADVKISMDGQGRYLDNIFIERLWRSLKQEVVYLHELQEGVPSQTRDQRLDQLLQHRAAAHGSRQTIPDDAFFDAERTQQAA